MDEVQVLLYTSYLHIIGGIETFMYNFIDLMSEHYTIGVYCPRMPKEVIDRISQKAKIYQSGAPISCNTLIMVRMMDEMPSNIKYVKSIRMCHATKSNPSWFIRQDCDKIVHVSEVSKQTFESSGDVIHNPLIKSDDKAILLVSATRIPAMDKGKNAERIIKLAKMLNAANIPFLWFNFSDQPIPNAPKGLFNVGTFQNVQPYIAKADYLVQLSDQEGFGLSVLEALINQTAVICTPFGTTKELGVKDGVNGYIVPFDMSFDVHKLLDVPQFTYKYDNEAIVKKWCKLIDKKSLRKRMKAEERLVRVKQQYYDIALKRTLPRGEVLVMPIDRVMTVKQYGYIEEVIK